MLPYDYRKIFKNTYSEEQLRMAASEFSKSVFYELIRRELFTSITRHGLAKGVFDETKIEATGYGS